MLPLQVPLQPPRGPEPQPMEEEANGGDIQDEDMLGGAEEELRVQPSRISLPTEAPAGAAPTPAPAPPPAPAPAQTAVPEDKPDSPALLSRTRPSTSAAPSKAQQQPPPADEPKEPNRQQSPPQPPGPAAAGAAAAATTPEPPKSLHSRQNGDAEPRSRTNSSALAIFRQPRVSQSNAAFGSPSQVQ